MKSQSLTNVPGNSSALELDLEQLKPEDSPRKRGRPPGRRSARLPECPYCHGEFKLLNLHKEKCSERPALLGLEQPAPQKITVEISATSVGMIIAGGFDLYALQKKLPHWHLQETQAEALGASWKSVIDAYWPDAGSQKIIILLLALANTLEVLKQKAREGQNVASRPSVHRPRPNGEDDTSAGALASESTGAGL